MTDEELMLAVCEGDRSAYQTIVNQHLKSISHYAFRILGNQKDTEDISQEVFLRLWINARKWNPEKAKLSTWLHRIAHNLCIDYLRKHGRVQTQESFEEEIEQKLNKLYSGAYWDERKAKISIDSNYTDNDSLGKLRNWTSQFSYCKKFFQNKCIN